VGLLDSIGKYAPTLAAYPASARALFVTAFVAALASFGVYVGRYSDATRAQQAAQVSLAVTPSVVAFKAAVNAGELNLPPEGEPAAKDPFDRELEYTAQRRRDGIHFVASQPYLEAMRGGGPVDARAALSPVPWTSARRPLALDLKVTNNRSDAIFFETAVIEVASSAPDDAAVPVPTTLHDHPRRLTLVNQGWGGARDVVLRFNLSRDAGAASVDPPFAHVARLGTLQSTAELDLDGAFAAEGVDVAALRASEEPGGPKALDEIGPVRRRAARPFAISRTLGPDEVTVPLAGQLTWRDTRSGAAHTMAIRAAVPATIPFGLGDFQPATARYRAVALAPRGTRYERRVPLAQTVKAGGTDRFVLPVVVAQSSTHRLRVRLLYNGDDEVASAPLVLEMFVPRLG
jgi:hypothetical protein